ncbi:hypothetical protein [Brumimicrobium mesophilum]|uniref:hypothetical protein n=1 Tax=Brumimicrobium mesophilum TaxID=392717 RepID=UPI000D140D2C|nr:hypothetical protein [Brumimicrobium mesophilum]
MQNSLKYLILICLLSLVGKFSLGQVIADFKDISIFLGDKQKSKSNVVDFIRTNSGELLCIQNENSISGIFTRYNSKYKFGFINGYSLPKTQSVTFYGNGKKSSLTHYTVLGNNILGLTAQSNMLNKESEIFYHFINPNAQGNSNHGYSLHENFFYNQEIDISQLTLMSSDDKKAASLIYVKESLPNDYSSIKYLNFKDDTSLPQGGELIYPFVTKDYEFLDFYTQNENTQFIVAGHFINNQPRNNFMIQEPFFHSLSIGKIENQELTYELIDGKGNFFTEVGLYKDGEGIIVSGLYSPFVDGDITGVFTIKVNKKGELINEKFSAFSDDLATSITGLNTSFMDDQYTIRNEYKGFDILQFEPAEDGYIGIAEFNALEYRYSGTDVPGASNSIDSYFWSNDVLVFKLDTLGELKWNVLTPKYQRSINDGGYYLSTTYYISNDKVHLFFNDNLLNYDEFGNYNKNGDDPLATQFSSGKNTIGHVSINKENGAFARKSTIGKEESDLLFTPQLSSQFTETKKLKIYARSGKRYRLGSINFR